MSQSAYIKLVKGSSVSSVSINELRDLLEHYQNQLVTTGKQLGWSYENASFPYTFETSPEGGEDWFYLRGKNDQYYSILLGIGSEQLKKDTETESESHNEEETSLQHYIHVVLPKGSTHGDKAKANEICKHLGKKLKAELHLFNGRILYYNPRK
ncbi:DUF1885 family protein [Longirhabdus pacifica]|uniref:DUF1885 family protein n=1 Tax=Longirhabdus pacifica TaxID=2305227 RepID=UPI0010090402|nr:DUF1885 family protein [Longirhabdus pacifica]